MTSSRIPKNAYTHAPEQHPNLILGSFQLLFWLVFRPRAWENHIHRLHSSLDKNVSLRQLLRRQRWRQRQIRRFVLQGFILLPILTSSIVGAISLALGTPFENVALGVVTSVALGVAGGMAFGAAFDVTSGVPFGVLTGVMLGVAGRVAFGVASGMAAGMAVGVVFGVEEGVALGVALGVAVGVMVGVAVNVGAGVVAGIGCWVNWWRPVIMSVLLVPWHFLLYRIDQSRAGKFPSLLCRHLAFWDEWQSLPIWGLDKHLLLVLDLRDAEGRAALDYLSTSRQRWAAQAAQIELDARQLERCHDAPSVGQIHRTLSVGELEGPADALFRSFNRISQDVDAALHQASAYNQRLALTAIGDRLDGLLRELTRSSDKYAVRFRPIAHGWYDLINLKIKELAQAAELRQEIDCPYIIGIPLTPQQEIFVGRTEIGSRIEQLLLDRRRPPLLLYGQRRTGKTSLLYNLGRLLPNSIVPLFVDLQGPASSASNHAGLLYNLAKAMTKSAKDQRNLTLPPLPHAALADDPFTSFDEWLDAVEATLGENTALLAFDEFESLDDALVEGRFSETAVLGMLRNLIQHRPRFKVLLSGSHTLAEFQRWSNYLINAQVLHLSYLQPSEARKLVEEPYEGFALRYEADASQRVLDVTRGHPFLVQLLCTEIVFLKNEQDPSIRRLATLTDVEAAIPEALSSGSLFFSEIEGNQLDDRALAILRYLADRGEGATVSESDLAREFLEGIEGAIELLHRRELIETTSGGYRIQVELIRRWFAG